MFSLFIIIIEKYLIEFFRIIKKINMLTLVSCSKSFDILLNELKYLVDIYSKI